MSNDTQSTGGNDMPPSTDGLRTLEDVDRAERQFRDAVRDANHPYFDAGRAVQRDWVEYHSALVRRRIELEGGDDGLDPVTRSMKEGFEQREQEQAARTARAEAAFSALAGDDDDYDLECPSDLVEIEVRSLELAALAAKGQWDQAMDEVRRLIEEHPRIPSAIQQRFDLIQHMPSNATEHRLLDLDQVLHGLCCEGRRRMGLPPRSLGNSEQQAADGHMLDVDEAEARIKELRATPGYMQINSGMSSEHRQVITNELLSLYQRIESIKQGD